MEMDGLPTPRRYWSMATIFLALTIAVVDASIANVILPTIAEDLHASASASVWVVNAYQLATVVSLLPLASLGEVIGYRKVYQAGLALFTLASLACALAPNLPLLALARVAQGLGGAGIMSMNGALVRHTYPHRMLGRAIGLNAMVVALASALGPTLSSAILAVGSWHWLFAINVPIGLVAMGIAVFALPHTEHAPRRYDGFAAALNALTFGPLVLGAETLVRGGNRVLGLMGVALGVVAGTSLVRRSLSQSHPLIPIDLLRIPVLAISIGASFTTFIAQTLAYVSLPFVMQHALGRTAVETGLLMTPWPLALALLAPIAGRLADKPISKVMGPVGLLGFALGLVLLGFLPAHAGWIDISWRMAVCGIGFALFQSPNNRAIMGSAPRQRVGSAGGLLATARLSGQTVGATLVAFLFHVVPGPKGAVLPLFVGGAMAVAAAAVSSLKLATYDPGAGDPRPGAAEL